MLDMDDFEKKLENQDVKLVAISGGSNVTGYTPDIHKIARLAHDAEAKILVDGAQRLAHMELDVKPIDHPEHIDYLAGAGHKTYAPFGSAFLMGTKDEMDEAPPYIPAGGTVLFVGDDEVVFAKGMDRHQPGTPNIGGAVALGAAMDFLSEIGMDWVRKHELELMEPVLKRFEEIEGLTVLGDIPLDLKLGVIAFNIDGLYHAELSKMLDAQAGIATRNGCFCAHPYLARLLSMDRAETRQLIEELKNGQSPLLPGAVRASIGVYNNMEEMEILMDTVTSIAKNQLVNH
jgi:selenocysteine lyase/cysteine desulfurase